MTALLDLLYPKPDTLRTRCSLAAYYTPPTNRSHDEETISVIHLHMSVVIMLHLIGVCCV